MSAAMDDASNAERKASETRSEHRSEDERTASQQPGSDKQGLKDIDEDPKAVDWDGPSDVENPMNFSTAVKAINVSLISALTFLTPLASSMLAPGVPLIRAEFNNHSNLLADFVVSVYVLGFALGPLLIAPLSELYGRVVVYHVCNVGFVIFNIACAVSTDMGILIVFRFFAGCFGSAPVTNGGGTIADLIAPQKRGGVIAIYALGPILGPVIGPLIAGYLVAARGWRWVFWFLAIVSGGFTLISVTFPRETYPPVLLERKTQRSRKARNNPGLRSKLDKSLTPGQLFARSIIRPTKILFMSPIVLLLSIYMGIVYGYQYLMFSTFSAVFERQYGFSTQSIGLSFLGIGIGSLIGLFAMGAVSDRIVKARAKPSKKNPEGKMQPEFRLPPLVAGAFFIPAGLFMYGWTAQYKEPWIAPEIGTALVGIGNMAVFMVVVTYLVDAFTIYAASALAANTVVRSIMGALLPLAGQKLYASLGVGWGNSLLGFIAVACIPVPWALMKYGEQLRTSFDSSRL